MTKLIGKAAFASILGFTLLGMPAFAQDDHDAQEPDMAHAEETHAAQSTQPVIEEPEEVSVTGQVQLSALLFEHISRGVLAMDGDRETADLRRETALWLDHLAGRMERDIDGLVAAEENLARASDRETQARAEMRSALTSTLSQAMQELEEVRSGDIPDELAARLTEVEHILDALEEATTNTSEMRDMVIDMSFADPLEEDVRDALIARLIDVQTNTGVVIDFNTADIAQNIHLDGEAPVTLSTLELRTALTSLYEENMDVLTPEGEEAEPVVDVPAPSFVGITLD